MSRLLSDDSRTGGATYRKSPRQLLREANVDEDVVYYWGYMYDLARDYIIPYLEKHGLQVDNSSVIEIGCGEGGNLCAMSEAGAAKLVGTDIADVRLQSAATIARILGVSVELSPHDIIYEQCPDEWKGQFDIALLRDVIEHLDDPAVALKNIKPLLRTGGALYVTFPPWYSPFGAHQQLLMNFAGKIPFVHYLPGPLFNRVIATGRANDVVEVRRLRRIRMTTSKMRRAAEEAGFSIADEQLFFIRPVFKSKFGLPTIGANMLKPLPGIRDVFALEAGYLLRADG